jgi:hypothetical protein
MDGQIDGQVGNGEKVKKAAGRKNEFENPEI